MISLNDAIANYLKIPAKTVVSVDVWSSVLFVKFVKGSPRFVKKEALAWADCKVDRSSDRRWRVSSVSDSSIFAVVTQTSVTPSAPTPGYAGVSHAPASMIAFAQRQQGLMPDLAIAKPKPVQRYKMRDLDYEMYNKNGMLYG